MRTLITILSVVLLVPTLAHAAYLDPTTSPPERLANGSTKVIYYFRGNAGEVAVDIPYVAGPGTTDQEIQNWVDERIKELEQADNVAKLQSLQNGATVARLPRVKPAQRASDVWQRKVANYAQFCTRGFAGAIDAGCAAMKSDIETTYRAGFLDAQ